MDRFTPLAVVVTLLMDVSLNSLLEPVSAHISVVILITVLQVSLPMCAMVFLFVMLMRTKLLQAGNFGALLYKFRSLFMIAPIYISFLLAIRAIRIEAYARNVQVALLWDIPGYFEVFIVYRLVAVLFYFFLLRTLMRLGDPLLYVQRVAPEIDLEPDFCKEVSDRQFRAVPQIIRGTLTLEILNRGVALLNQIIVDKYQLLALDLRELHALNTSEEALTLRKRWELQSRGDDVGEVDCFSDQDLTLHREISSDAWKDIMQVLKHINHLIPIKSTRHFTLFGNDRRASDVQQWAATAGERIRLKLRELAYRDRDRDRPGSVAAGFRGALGGGGANPNSRTVTFH